MNRNAMDTDSTVMITATPQLAGASIETTFKRPRPFSKEQLDQLAVWITDAERGLGVRPEQVRVRNGDVMFEYELSAVLFNGLGMLRVNAMSASLIATGARTDQDIDVLRDSVTRFIGEISGADVTTFTVSAHTYAVTVSADVRDEYLARFRFGPEIISAGGIGLVRVESWPESIRVVVEAAIESPENLFIAWNTRFQISEQWRESLANLPKTFICAARALGVTLEKVNV
jgi:hypothetical protein